MLKKRLNKYYRLFFHKCIKMFTNVVISFRVKEKKIIWPDSGCFFEPTETILWGWVGHNQTREVL